MLPETFWKSVTDLCFIHVFSSQSWDTEPDLYPLKDTWACLPNQSTFVCGLGEDLRPSSWERPVGRALGLWSVWSVAMGHSIPTLALQELGPHIRQWVGLVSGGCWTPPGSSFWISCIKPCCSITTLISIHRFLFLSHESSGMLSQVGWHLSLLTSCNLVLLDAVCSVHLQQEVSRIIANTALLEVDGFAPLYVLNRQRSLSDVSLWWNLNSVKFGVVWIHRCFHSVR